MAPDYLFMSNLLRETYMPSTPAYSKLPTHSLQITPNHKASSFFYLILSLKTLLRFRASLSNCSMCWNCLFTSLLSSLWREAFPVLPL